MKVIIREVKVSHLVSGLGGTLSLASPSRMSRLLMRSGTDQQIRVFGSAEEAMAG